MKLSRNFLTKVDIRLSTHKQLLKEAISTNDINATRRLQNQLIGMETILKIIQDETKK